MHYLILEDNMNDLKLLVRQLSKVTPEMNYDAVKTESEFVDTIKREKRPDIILSDYNLSGFKGTDAFKIMQKAGIDVPFIMVTGTLEDRIASEVLKLGLDDYILKDRLHRLPSAIETAMDRHRLRMQHKLVIEELMLSEKRLRTVLEQAPYGVILTDSMGKMVFYNLAAKEMFGYSEGEILGNRVEMLLPERYAKNHQPKRDGYVGQSHPRPLGSGMVFYGKRKNGEEFPLDIMLSAFDRDGKREVMVLMKDITEQHKIEQERKEFTEKLKQEVESQTYELKEANAKLKEYNKDIRDSIVYAERLQKAVLPNLENLKRTVTDAFVLYRPKDIVSGDFYWYFQRDDETILVAADCTGHGVPGAFMSIMGIELLQKVVIDQDVRKPSIILELLNDGLNKTLSQAGDYSLGDGMDIAICRIKHAEQKLQFAGAGSTIIHVSSDGAVNAYKNGRFGLGGAFRRSVHEFSDDVITFNNGEMLYMFSDGYPDQFGGPDNRKFMMADFKRMLAEIHARPIDLQEEHLNRTFEDWKGQSNQIDDVMVLGIKL